jgi:hypothetical protein
MRVKEYDPETCVTAAELRAMGVQLDATVPDCAWVPRSALKVGVGEARFDPEDRSRILVPATLTLEEPLRWIEVAVTVEGAGT